MSVARLTLTDFRSYPSAEMVAGPGFVVLTGDNGAGKTNILEAVSLLAPGRGLRGAPLGDMARQGGIGGFSVAAMLADGTQLGTGTLAQAPERRLVRVNSTTTSANGLSERLSVVWLTPAQDRLFTDSAGARRRFLDRLVLALEPGHARHVTRYEAAMRERNRLLAEGRADPAWLDALELAMAEHGAAISTARLQLVVALSDQPDDADFPTSRLQLSNLLIEGLQQRLATSRQRDAAAGRTPVGPQTQDLLVDYAAKNRSAAQSSTGEQKALLIGLVLAHAALVAERRGRPPILLLDEVAAHLDPARRAALFERLQGRGQVWMTGTESAAFGSLPEADRFRVADGRVEPV